MQFKVIENRELWDAFVSAHPRASVLQSFSWGEVKSRQNWEPLRYGVLEGERVLAVASVLKRKLPYPGKCIFYAPRGPVVDFTNPALLDVLFEGLKEEAKKHKAVLLKIDPLVREEERPVIIDLEKRGLKLAKKQVQPRTTLYVDLARDLDEILMSFEEKTRYNIRLSAKKGVVVKEEPEEGLDNFYNIYKETAGRDNFMIHPRSYYERIQELLVEEGMGNIFTAYYQEKPIASVFVLSYGKKVWYMYGASSSEFRNVMPNHALHWDVIKWAKERGYEIYDLWGIPSNPGPEHPLWGVYRFKKGFNGELVKYAGVFDLSYDPLFNFFFEKALDTYVGLRSLIKKGKISDSLKE